MSNDSTIILFAFSRETRFWRCRFLFLECTHGELIGDGNCNDESNNEDCIYDADDCCGSCVNTELCTQCACLSNLTGNGYSNSLLGNGICDDETNTLECAYDGLECCGSNATIDHCTECACHGKKIPIFFFFQPRINCICFFKRKVFVPFPNNPVLSKGPFKYYVSKIVGGVG